MKTVCIYHSRDLDGWMSAAIVKYWNENNKKDYLNSPKFKEVDIDFNIDFLGWDYGDEIPDLSEYDKVIMCDISFPKEEMDDLRESKEVGNFIWLDHHISAIQSCSNYPYGIRDTNYAACELTWKYFFPNQKMPEIVRLLGRYDCFGHKGTDEEQKVLEFQYGARQCISNYEDAYQYLNWTYKHKLSRANLQVIWGNGKAIYSYLCTEAKQTYNKAVPIILNNKPTYNIDISNIQNVIDSDGILCLNCDQFKEEYNIIDENYSDKCWDSVHFDKITYLDALLFIKLKTLNIKLSDINYSDVTWDDITNEPLLPDEEAYESVITGNMLSGKNSKFNDELDGYVENNCNLFLCVNQERFNPINFGIDYHKDGYDGFACFWYKDGKWAFSLYNDNGEVDCSAIAKRYGGGGHKGAAGFVTDDLNKILNL